MNRLTNLTVEPIKLKMKVIRHDCQTRSKGLSNTHNKGLLKECQTRVRSMCDTSLNIIGKNSKYEKY